MRYFFIGCILIILTIGGFFCKETPPEPPPPSRLKTIFLAADDTGVTDAILHVSIFNTEKPSRFVLRRDGKTILTSQYPTLDTLIVSDSLLPNRTYTYRAYRLADSIAVDSSATVTITTMDTTSHSFIWQLDTLGDGNSSTLYDVAIINDTCVWVVGELYFRDSTGHFSSPAYNAVRWDGMKWNLVRILVKDFGTVTGYFPLKAVYGFDSRNIWFAGDADLIHWDGTSFTSKAFFGTSIPFNGQVLKMWGSSSSNIFCAGRTGAIYRFEGTSWQKLESGTTLDIQDIYGSRNARTGTLEILAVASNPFGSNERKILKITGTTISEVSDSGIQLSLSSVWFSQGQKYYLAGSGIYEKRLLSEKRWKNGQFDITNYHIFGLRGNAINDVAAAGGFGEVLHYNGNTWQSYHSSTQMAMGNYLSVEMKGNLIVAVGENYNRAAVALGRRR